MTFDKHVKDVRDA